LNLAAQPREPIIRLTIDARGIKKIERLATSPRHRDGRLDRLAFVIVKDEDVTDVVVHFKVRCPNPPEYFVILT
jgi:hypothetical protein